MPGPSFGRYVEDGVRIEGVGLGKCFLRPGAAGKGDLRETSSQACPMLTLSLTGVNGIRYLPHISPDLNPIEKACLEANYDAAA